MTATRDYLTVPALAQSLGVDQDKVLGWIHCGELLAIDVSERRGGRPRWRIPADAWERFQQLRSNQANLPAAPARRRRRNPNVIQFFR